MVVVLVIVKKKSSCEHMANCECRKCEENFLYALGWVMVFTKRILWKSQTLMCIMWSIYVP